MSFQEFCRAKRADALAANLPRYETLLDGPPAGRSPIGNHWSRSLFDGDFYVSAAAKSLPACSLVFVQSRDGNTGAANPSALGGGETDKHLIYEGLSRAAADGVLAGAGTVGRGNAMFSVWHPEIVRLRESLGLPRHPAQIVATGRGMDLDRGWLFNTPEIRVFVIATAAAAGAMGGGLAARSWVVTIVIESERDLRAAFEELRGGGIERLSAVGGRTMATALIDAGLVQDIYLTTSPRPGGEPGTPMYPKPLQWEAAVRKAGTGAEEGVTFEHLIRPS